MYFTIYKDVANQWRWRLQAANHEIIAVSSESYLAKSSCSYAIGLVKGTNFATPVYER